MKNNSTMKILSDVIKAGSNPARGFTELGLVDRPELDEPISRSRRIIVAGGISSLALAALGIRYCMPSDNEQAEMLVHYDKRVYSDGDLINTHTSLGEVRVDGWKIEFHKESILDALNEGIDFRFTATCSRGTQHGYFEGNPRKNPQIKLDDLVDRSIDPNIPTLVLPTGNHYYFTVLPHLEASPITKVDDTETTLELAIYRSRAPKSEVNIHRYRIKNLVFSYPPQDQNDSVRVICERNIRRDYLKPIHQLQRLFSEYKDPSLFFILDEDLKKNRGFPGKSTEFAESNRYTDVNYLTMDGFRMPFFPRQAEIGACHEVAHNIFNAGTISQYLGTMDAELKAKQEFKDKFDALRDYDNAQPASGIFSIFTESTYFGNSVYGVRSDAGHPRDEHSELFASTVCVLRYFGREFSEKYAKLKSNERRLVIEACDATLRVLIAMNPSQLLLRRVFPDIDYISKRTGITHH